MQTQTELSHETMRADYERDGYLIVPPFLSQEECLSLKEEGLRVLAEQELGAGTVFVGVAVASKIYYEFASHPGIVKILRALMPEGVSFMSDKFVFKSGEARFPTPWHQDKAYWQGTRPKISVWIPLDDVVAENGALKVMPGSHHGFLGHGETSKRTDLASPTGEFSASIETLPQDAPGEIICEMKQGSALFFSDLLAHASCPNTSGKDRYAIIGTYQAPAEDEPFDTHFAARHVIVPAS